jgi:hypothetical protein
VSLNILGNVVARTITNAIAILATIATVLYKQAVNATQCVQERSHVLLVLGRAADTTSENENR